MWLQSLLLLRPVFERDDQKSSEGTSSGCRDVDRPRRGINDCVSVMCKIVLTLAISEGLVETNSDDRG